MQLFIVFTIFATCVCVQASGNQNLKSGGAAYFKEHSNIITYETSAKLIFKVDLPDLSAYNPGQCDGIDYECIAEKTIYNRKQEFITIMQFRSGIHSPQKRVKRQVVIAAAAIAGYALHSVLATLGKKLFGTDQEAEHQINRIGESFVAHEREFLISRHQIDLYSQNVSRALNRSWWFDSKAEKQARSLLYLSQVNQYMDRLSFGIMMCSTKKIPFQFVSESEFTSKLQSASQNVSSVGYSLAVPASDVKDYTDLPIASCLFTSSGVYVMINLPLYKNKWNLFELIPVPFRYMNQTCMLDSRHTDLVAIGKTEVKIIDMNSRVFCDFFREKLCLIPTFQRPTEQSAQCAWHVYGKGSIENIGNVCQFKCYSRITVIVTDLEEDLVSVANGKVLTVACPNISKEIILQPFGATEISGKCNCTYQVDSNPIHFHGLCANELFRTDDISHIVPHFWLTPISGSQFNIGNNWTNYIPILNFTRSDTLDDTKIIDTKFRNDHRDIWLIVVSSFIVVLAMISIVFCALFCRVFR